MVSHESRTRNAIGTESFGKLVIIEIGAVNGAVGAVPGPMDTRNAEFRGGRRSSGGGVSGV